MNLVNGDLVHFVSLYWFLFALIAALLLMRPALERINRPKSFVGEFSFVWALALTYFLVRGMVSNQTVVAHAHAHTIISTERYLHLYHEAGLQQFAQESPLLLRFANHVYVWWHWPLIVGVLIWLYLQHPEQFRIYRNAFVISGLIGMAIFFLYPVAPPRLVVDIPLVDTVDKRAIFNNILLPPSLTNLYAAMPSLHAGWNLLIGIALFRHARHPAARVFGVVMPVLMWWSIVVTGNHYILDGLAGDAIAELSLVAALLLARQRYAPRQLAPVEIRE